MARKHNELVDGELSLTEDSIIDPGKAGRLWPGLSLDLLHNPPIETDELDVTDVSAYTPSKLAPVAETTMPQPTASNSGNIQISITSECNFDINLLYFLFSIRLVLSFKSYSIEKTNQQRDKYTNKHTNRGTCIHT